MNNWNKICGLLTIFFLSALFSVAQDSQLSKYDPSLLNVKPTLPATSVAFNRSIKTFPLQSSQPKILPQDYYTQHFGFFCKKELALEKATKLPIRIRVGSLQQCNYLEGKNR